VRATPLADGGGAGAGAAPARRARPSLLAAFAELRFRLLWQRLRGGSGIPELVSRIVAFAVAIPAGLVLAVAVGAAAYAAVRAGEGLRAQVPTLALFFGIWQAWTAIALSVSDHEALDLARFLVYPIPPVRLWAYGLAGSIVGDPFAVFWCLLLAGGLAGAAVARPGAWVLLLALVYTLFALATAATIALLQELLARLLRRRAPRAIAVAAIYGGGAFLVAWGAGSGRLGQVTRAVRTLRWVMFPPAFATEASTALYAGRIAAALPWIAGLAVATLGAAALAYRLALAQALAGGAAAAGRGSGRGQGWPLPGRLGALLEKEGKYLARHPLAAVLGLVIPALAALVGWQVAPRIPAEAGEPLRAVPLLGFALYAHLATEVFWLNAFGWDRGGARLLFLSPLPLADALRAKNVAVYALSAGIFAASAALLAASGGATHGWELAGAGALHAGLAPWLLAAGNVVSILNPRAAAYALQRGSRLSPASALAGMAIVSGGAGLFAAPVLLALRLDAPWVLVGVWVLLGVAGAIVYRLALPRTAALLARRREVVLAAVAGDDA
jgi:ABC-2 type transport system permease protein